MSVSTWERLHFAGVFGLLVAVAVLASVAPIGGDLWFHLATGDWILNHGAIPSADPFSHTATNALVVHGWLADVAFALTRRTLGLGGLRALQAAVLLSALLAWGALLFRLGWARPLAAILPFGVLVLFADRIRLRPDLLSFLAFPLWLLLVEAWRRDGRVLCKPALGALVLTALWSNVHPAVLLTPVLAGALWLGETVRRRWAEPTASLPLAAAALLFLATCANPYGPKLYLYAANVGGQVGAFVGEWGPSWNYFKIPTRWGHALAPWIGGLLLGAGLVRERREPERAWVLAGLVALAWSLFSARFLYLLAIPLATCLPTAWRRPTRPVRFGGALALAVLLSLVIVREPALRLVLRAPQQQVRGARFPFPEAEVAILRDQPDSLRLWHPWGWGSRLTDRLGGRHRIFADGRLVLYGPQVLRDNLTISAWARSPAQRAGLRPKKQALLDQYEVDALLVPPGFWAEGPGWRRVARSPTGELWLRSP